MKSATLFLAFVLSGCAAVAPSYRDQSVTIASSTSFDPARYVGRWYEIARYPNPFQANCAGAIADYAVAEGGGVLIRNSCLDETGRETAAITGAAQVTGPGRLSVRLQGVPVAAPYWVLWVDADYRVAVVGQPNGRAGWVLARTPDLSPDLWAAAQEILDFNGYDVGQLRRSVTP